MDTIIGSVCPSSLCNQIRAKAFSIQSTISHSTPQVLLHYLCSTLLLFIQCTQKDFL